MPNHRVLLLLEQMDYTFGQGGWFRALDQATEGLTAQQASWSPGHGVNSIWQTVNHLTFWKDLCSGRLKGAPLSDERIDNAATFDPVGATGDQMAWQAAVERLRHAHQAFRTAVAQLTDQQLDEPLPGETTPLKELLLGLNVHDGYHLGQIVVLRKLQGSWNPRCPE
jgi:uncharacterized damage-inducible protein DinB